MDAWKIEICRPIYKKRLIVAGIFAFDINLLWHYPY